MARRVVGRAGADRLDRYRRRRSGFVEFEAEMFRGRRRFVQRACSPREARRGGVARECVLGGAQVDADTAGERAVDVQASRVK